jgi:hypothetical protein
MAYQNKKELIWIDRFLKLILFLSTILALVLSVQFGMKFNEEKLEIKKTLAETYHISLDSTYGVQCYNGYLHYPNQGNFSGLLAFSPSIKCNLNEFKTLTENKYTVWFTLSILSTAFSLLLAWATKVK